MLERITVRIHKRVLGLVEIRGLLLSSKPYVDEIEKLRKIPSVKAILMRVDSPGGAVVPSQEIYEAVRRAREQKPVIASLGSVAASGAYYVASAADRIYANSGSLTGSIGVVMHVRNIQGLLTKIGVSSSVIKSGQYKDVGSPFREMTPREEQFLQGVSDDVYGQFLDAVAAGRGTDRERLEGLADGKIYTGRQAMELGLVDEIGGLQRAILDTGKRVGIPEEPPRVVSFRRRRRMLTERFVQGTFRNLLHAWEAEAGSLGGLLLVCPSLDTSFSF
ncbi:MAG: signal peptide peptidase SppA [bacterium]